MNIGLYDVDSHNFPNLALMKISAWHKAHGDNVEFVFPFKHYDKIYVSKVFGDEYSQMSDYCLQADEIVYGGTGFAITIENGKEVYHKDRDPNLSDEIEHIYPDYSLYPTRAWVDFTQGLDARFITVEVAQALSLIKKKVLHFAFDFMKNEKAVMRGLHIYRNSCEPNNKDSVYILTNFDTTIDQDLYRVKKVQEVGLLPDIRIYRKSSAPRILRDLQRWCNNRRLYHSCDFMDYVPRKDGKTIKELYYSNTQ